MMAVFQAYTCWYGSRCLWILVWMYRSYVVVVPISYVYNIYIIYNTYINIYNNIYRVYYIYAYVYVLVRIRMVVGGITTILAGGNIFKLKWLQPIARYLHQQFLLNPLKLPLKTPLMCFSWIPLIPN